MAVNPSNGSKLEQLALKGLIVPSERFRFVKIVDICNTQFSVVSCLKPKTVVQIDVIVITFFSPSAHVAVVRSRWITVMSSFIVLDYCQYTDITK